LFALFWQFPLVAKTSKNIANSVTDNFIEFLFF